MNRILLPGLFSLLTFLLGYGLSQTLTAAQVNVLCVEVNHLRRADARIEQELSAVQNRLQQQLASLSGLIEKVLQQNQQFIELLRVQNELLQRR